jgi:hypothetical protein
MARSYLMIDELYLEKESVNVCLKLPSFKWISIIKVYK